MSYPYRPPGPYRAPEPTVHKIEVHDAFWTGFKVTCGVMCALLIWSVLAAMFWVVVLGAIVAGQS